MRVPTVLTCLSRQEVAHICSSGLVATAKDRLGLPAATRIKPCSLGRRSSCSHGWAGRRNCALTAQFTGMRTSRVAEHRGSGTALGIGLPQLAWLREPIAVAKRDGRLGSVATSSGRLSDTRARAVAMPEVGMACAQLPVRVCDSASTAWTACQCARQSTRWQRLQAGVGSVMLTGSEGALPPASDTMQQMDAGCLTRCCHPSRGILRPQPVGAAPPARLARQGPAAVSVRRAAAGSRRRAAATHASAVLAAGRWQ